MKIVIIITYLSVFFLPVTAQVNSETGIIFDSTLYHFGSVKKGSVEEHVFSFVNKNKTPVVISNVRTYCSCITVTWTKEPVKPNASGEVKVIYHAITSGTFSKTVKVFTNLSEKSIDLSIKGQCREF